MTFPLIFPCYCRLPHVWSQTSPISPFPQCKRAGHGNFSNHLDVLQWFETPKHPRDFRMTWSMLATSPWQVADFHETSPWHLTPGSFGEVGIMEFGLNQFWQHSCYSSVRAAEFCQQISDINNHRVFLAAASTSQWCSSLIPGGAICCLSYITVQVFVNVFSYSSVVVWDCGLRLWSYDKTGLKPLLVLVLVLWI